MACNKCGEEDCEAQRAAFAREPWLPGGFEIGAQWYSYDNGITWQRFPCFRATGEATGSMTVTGIDQKTGTVTIAVAP